MADNNNNNNIIIITTLIQVMLYMTGEFLKFQIGYQTLFNYHSTFLNWGLFCFIKGFWSGDSNIDSNIVSLPPKN